MKKLIQASTIVFAITATGCATDKHIYNADGACITCFNNPFTGEPINHQASEKHLTPQETTQNSNEEPVKVATATKAEQSFEMHQVSLNLPVDVDVAFIKLKSEFRFQSEDEVRKEMGTMADFKLRSSDYEWKALPSVSYTMGSARELMGERMNLTLVINKVSNTKSNVTAMYWPRSKAVNTTNIGNHLKSRIQKAIGS